MACQRCSDRLSGEQRLLEGLERGVFHGALDDGDATGIAITLASGSTPGGQSMAEHPLTAPVLQASGGFRAERFETDAIRHALAG